MTEDEGLTAARHGRSPALRAQGKIVIDSIKKDGTVVLSCDGFYAGTVRNVAMATYIVAAVEGFWLNQTRGLSAVEGSTKPEDVTKE